MMDNQTQSGKRYIVVWVSKTTGAKGQGITRFDYETAKGWADFYNQMYPDLVHSVELAAPRAVGVEVE